MTKTVLLLLIGIAIISCHKEEPFDFSYTAKPAREDVFHHLDFFCQEVNGPSSFVGTVDGRSYCLYDTNKTDVLYGMATIISTPDPVINPYNDSNAVCTAFQYYMLPKEAKAGTFHFLFTFYSDGLTGYTKEGFFREYFVPGLYLPLSSYHTTSPPNVDGLKGASIELVVYDGFPGIRRGIPFTTSDIVQPDDAYIKCTRSEKTDSRYFIELDVNLRLPSRSRYEGEPEPEMKELKGKLVLQIEL